jgi:hypothetical protein
MYVKWFPYCGPILPLEVMDLSTLYHRIIHSFTEVSERATNDKGAVWNLSAQRDRASAEYDVAYKRFICRHNAEFTREKLTLSLSQRKDTVMFPFLSFFHLS